jgi:cell division septum initiation protein DivIVA
MKTFVFDIRRLTLLQVFSMAQLRTIRQQLNSVTECSICAGNFDDPRILPCVHTFCLACIIGFSAGRRPGQTVACPLCRNEFEIPDSGVGGLPKNIYVAQLKDVFTQVTSSCCEKHPDEDVKLYCVRCRAAVCTKCLVKHHRSHQCVDVDDVVDRFRQQASDDVASMTETAGKCHALLTELKKEKKTFNAKIAEIEKGICQQTELLKQAIQREKKRLLEALYASQRDRIQQINDVIDTTTQHLLTTNSLIRFAEELQRSENAGEIARQTDSLHDKANELQKLGVIPRAVTKLGSVGVTFTPAQWTVKSIEDITGKLGLKRSSGTASMQRIIQ